MPSSGGKTCARSEEHTSELQSHDNLVCRLLLEKQTSHTPSPPAPPSPRRPRPATTPPPSREPWVGRRVPVSGGALRGAGAADSFLKEARQPHAPPLPPPNPAAI